MDKEELIKILEDNKLNIEEGNWNAVYKNMDEYDRGEFSEFLIENDIDPSKMFKGEIPDWAFRHCSKLTSIIIPNNVKKIREDAFAYCNSLTSVTIPKSVKKIYDWAFLDCTSLNEIKYDGTKEEWDSVVKYTLWNDGCPAKIVFLR